LEKQYENMAGQTSFFRHGHQKQTAPRRHGAYGFLVANNRCPRRVDNLRKVIHWKLWGSLHMQTKPSERGDEKDKKPV
jgi:hypothetical protein